jgi:hypothetical protein
MKPATTILLAVILLVLGAFYYIHDVHLAGKKEEKKSREDRVLPFEGKTASGLSIKKGKELVAFEKKEGTWYITEPLQQRASTATLDTLTDLLRDTKQEKVIEENPGDLTYFGLKPPTAEMTVKAQGKDGEAPKDFTLFIGSKTPSGSSYYAQIPGKKAVMLIPSALSTELDKKPMDYQEKEPLPLDPAKVTRLTIQQGDRTMVLEKPISFWTVFNKEPQWNVSGKTVERGDRGKISAYLMDIKNVKAAEILDSKDSRNPAIQAGKPLARLTIEHSDRSPETLVIMPKTEKTKDYMAQREHSGEKLIIKEQDFSKLFKSQVELQDTRIVAFNPGDVQTLELKMVGQPPVTAEKNDEGWKVRKPAGIKKNLPSLDSLMYKLESTRYLEKCENDKSFPGIVDATITLQEKGAIPVATLEFAKNPSDPKKSYVKIQGAGSYIISEELLALLQSIVEGVKKAQEKPGKGPSPSPAATSASTGTTPPAGMVPLSPSIAPGSPVSVPVASPQVKIPPPVSTPENKGK